MRSGFSLVELSIVLVIIGLLTSGILVGQNLIHAAELRAVGSEYGRFVSSLQTFRDKYHGIPGDLPIATKFWGTSASLCSVAATNKTPGTCDGNGDGNIQTSTTANGTGEMFQYWNQLSLAGLIEGTYSGKAGPTARGTEFRESIIGENVPRSRLSNAGWSVINQGTLSDEFSYAYTYGNQLIFGAQSTGTITEGSALKAEDAWNIDSKLDDGKPGAGFIFVRDNAGFGKPGSCTNSASNTDRPGEYSLTQTAVACSLKFLKQF